MKTNRILEGNKKREKIKEKPVKRGRVSCNFFLLNGNISRYGVSTDRGIEG
jgi:hypothetical protein